jgi:hypothetical protein
MAPFPARTARRLAAAFPYGMSHFSGLHGCKYRQRIRLQGQEWIETRLEELAEIFAIAVGGFSVMDNHRFEPDGRRGGEDAGEKRVYFD